MFGLWSGSMILGVSFHVVTMILGVCFAKGDQALSLARLRREYPQHLPVLDFDTEVARTYAELYAQVLGQQRRSNLNVHDLQIAATALVQGYSILTTNVDDFNGIPGVRLISPYALQGNTIHEEQASYAPNATI